MASEYDALLKAAEPSPYDALLQDGEPESDYDALLSAAEPLSVPSTMKAPEAPGFAPAPSESTSTQGATVEGSKRLVADEEARKRYEQAGRDFLKNKEFDESPGAYAQRRTREAAGEKNWFQARKRTPMENLGDLNFTIKRFTTLPISRLLSNETAAEAFGRDVLSAKSSIDERAKVEEIKAKKSAGAQLSPAEDEVLKADETVEKIKAAWEAIKGQPDDVVKAILRDAFENAPLYYAGSRFVRLAAAPLASIRGISSFVAKAGNAGKAGKIGKEIAVEAAAAPLTGAPIAASMGQEYGTVDWLADVMASSVVGGAVGGGQVISDALRARALKPAQAKYAVGAIDRLEKSGKVTKQVADDARRVLREEAVSTELAARKAAVAPQAAAQADLLGGEQAVKAPAAAPVQAELLPSTPPQVSSAPIGAGRPDAGIEGLPMQEAADAALRAQVETDLFAPKPPASPKLPKNLEGAKPRYNYGAKGYTMKFDSDVDRALFIVSQKKKSKADDQYRSWLRESVGLDDAQIDAQAAALRNKIKPLARDGEGGELQIASSYAPKPAAAAQAAPARAAETAPREPVAARSAPKAPRPGKKYVKKGDLERWNDLAERKAAEKHLRRVTGVRKIDPDRVTTFLRELGDNPMPRPAPKLKPQPLPEPAKAYEFFGNRVLTDLPDKQTGTIRLYDADFGSLGLKRPGGEVDLAAAKRLFGGKKVELRPGNGSELAKRAEAFNEERISPMSEGGVNEYWIPPDDPQWADIEMDPHSGLTADDVAAAIINRPRGKAAERDARLEAYNRSPERRAELEAEAMDAYAKELETSGQLERRADGEFVPRSPEAAGFIGKSSYLDESGNVVDASTGEVIVRAYVPEYPELDVDPEMPANALTAGDDGGAGQVPPWPPAGGTPPNPDAPRIEQDVARFREIEQELGVEAARLARDEARSFAMLDGEARKMAEEWTPEQFSELASQRMLTDTEKVAATAQAKRAETEAEIARRKIDGAMEMGDEAGEASARLEYLGATSESLGLLAATINDATATARALNARKLIIEAARKGPANPDEVALKMLLDMDIDEKSAVDLVQIFKEDPSKFREILENMMQFGIWDKVRFYYKSALLSAIGTQGVNFIGNTLEQAALMAETFGSGVFDKILSGSDIASGRARYASEAFAEAAGARAAWPAAFAKLKSDAASTLRLEPAPISMNESFELQVNPIKGTFGKVVGVPFRVLQAMDEYTKTITQGAELSRLAMRRAQDELGDAPKELLMRRAAEISREIIDDPAKNADIWEKIEARKLEATFQERPGKIVEAIMEMERQGGVLGALTLAAVPFKKTPANIFRRAYKRSPLGFDSAIRAAKKWQAASKKAEAELMGARDKGLAPAEMKKLENRLASEVLDARGEVADALSRAALGSALFAGVFGAASAGLITGANPKDANKREALEATGWQPYSLVIPIPGARNVYIPLRRISGSLAPLLGVAADIANAVGDDTREQNLASVALASTMTNLQEQSYLQGVENVVDAFSQPERKLGYWLSGVAAGFVPNMVGSWARAVDPVRRDMRPKTDGGVGGGVEQLGNAVMARIPFVSKAMAPRYSPYGYALQRAGGGDPGSSVERFVSPAPTSSGAEYSLEKELVDAGYAPQTIPTSLRVGDVTVKLTQPEIDYLAGQRRVATERLRAKTATAWWKRMPPEKRVEKAKEHFSSETSATNARLRPVLKRRLRAAAKQSD